MVRFNKWMYWTLWEQICIIRVQRWRLLILEKTFGLHPPISSFLSLLVDFFVFKNLKTKELEMSHTLCMLLQWISFHEIASRESIVINLGPFSFNFTTALVEYGCLDPVNLVYNICLIWWGVVTPDCQTLEWLAGWDAIGEGKGCWHFPAGAEFSLWTQ